MDMSGSYDIPAPRSVVWEALNDVEVLKACIPGCESITRRSETELEATVSAKVGPVKAKFSGEVTLSEIDPPNGYTISGSGKGGAAGFAKGGAKVWLEDIPGGTKLSYEVNASVGGKLAQIGGRLINSTAKKMADEFFSEFSRQAAAASTPDAESAPAPEAQATPEHPSPPDTPPVSVPVPDRKPDPLNAHRPITFEIWAPMIGALFALGVIWLIFG
jgi:carbon monoxide dehydrogenase subunit G